jgi:hypothetical protein
VSLPTIRAAIADAAGGLTDLRGSAYAVDQIEAPMALVELHGIDYDLAYEGPDSYIMKLSLYVDRSNVKKAQERLDEFCEPTGAKSIKATLETASVATAAGAHYIRVRKMVGPSLAQLGAAEFLMVEFELEVVA